MEDRSESPECSGGGFGAFENNSVTAGEGLEEGTETEDIRRVPVRQNVSILRKKEYGSTHHGAMPKTTPYGSLYTMALLPSSESVGTNPRIVEIKPAISLHISIAALYMNWNIGGSEPVSSRMYFQHSSLRFSNISAALRKMSRR